MMTNKDYCNHETCVALEELGFPIRRIKVKGEEKRVPILLYEAQKWLREEKEIYVTVIPEYDDYRPVKGVKYRLEVAHWKDDEFGYETIEWLDEELYTIITFDSYEEALSEGVKCAVKLLKDGIEE